MATIMKLKNVSNGTICKHTGTKMLKCGKKVGTGFPMDMGLVFNKLSDSHQQALISKAEVILGANDLVEVLK